MLAESAGDPVRGNRRKWNWFCQFRIPVGNYQQGPITLRGFDQRAQDVECYELEWSRRRKQLQELRVTSQTNSFLCAASAIEHALVGI